MKTSLLSFVLVVSFLSLAACGGADSRTASDPSVTRIGASAQGDPTLPDKVVDLKMATAFANATGGGSTSGLPAASETAAK